MLNYQKYIQRYTRKNIDNGLIKPEERELYEYGYLLAALQLVNISGVIIIGVLFRCLLPMILFTICMIPLRSYAGGYHASSPERCTLLSLVLEIFVALTINWLLHNGSYIWLLGIALAGQFIIWIFAPIEAANKPLYFDEYNKYRKKARQILICQMFLLMVLILLNIWKFALMVALCHITAAILILAALAMGKKRA